jgi:protein SCO1/2
MIRGCTNTGWRVALPAAALCAALSACGRSPEPAATTAAQSQPETKRYQLTGKVVAVDRTGKRLTVDHEAIPGFMDAMTMSYPVKAEKELEGLSPGDRITATVVSTQGLYWLEDVTPSR